MCVYHLNQHMKCIKIRLLSAITRVDLSHNKLDIFPPLLWQLPSLRILNLSHNKLSTVSDFILLIFQIVLVWLSIAAVGTIVMITVNLSFTF